MVGVADLDHENPDIKKAEILFLNPKGKENVCVYRIVWSNGRESVGKIHNERETTDEGAFLSACLEAEDNGYLYPLTEKEIMELTEDLDFLI